VTILPRVRLSHAEGSDEKLRAVIYGVTAPRTAKAGELLRIVGERAGVPYQTLVLADLYRNRLHKVLDYHEPLASVREDDVLIAYERCMAPVTATTTPGATTAGDRHSNEVEEGCMALLFSGHHSSTKFFLIAGGWRRGAGVADGRRGWRSLDPAIGTRAGAGAGARVGRG
jgi:hypothetical protein